MERKDRIDSTGIAAMLGFALLFALNQVAVKLTVEAVQPVFAAGLRSALALVCLLIWMRWRGISFGLPREQIWGGLLIGLLFTAEFLCLFWALDLTTVSRASVVFYSMPIWLGLIAHFVLPGERLTGLRLLGFALAISGVGWALFDRSAGEANWLGDVLALLAALTWAGIALTVRLTPLSRALPETQLYCQLVISSLAFLAFAPLFGPLIRGASELHFLGLFVQAALVVFAGFLMWFKVLKVYPASDVAAFSFLSPVLSVVFGWLILGEQIGREIIGALFLVCIGLVLISRRPKRAS